MSNIRELEAYKAEKFAEVRARFAGEIGEDESSWVVLAAVHGYCTAQVEASDAMDALWGGGGDSTFCLADDDEEEDDS